MASLSPAVRPLARGNPRIKQARKLARRAFRDEVGLFIADGPHAVEGALRAGLVTEVFVRADAAQKYAGWRELDQRASWTLVDAEAMSALSDTRSPQGVVAVCRQLPQLGVEVLSGATLVAICVDVADPGNAGTVIRTADAAGADAVILAGRGVDVMHPKLGRASVGSLFHLPVLTLPDAQAAIAAARTLGLQVLAADGAGSVELFAADELLAQPTAWLFGNEAHGLAEETLAEVDQVVRIPILGRAESLNLGTAAAVCLYASARLMTR